jgi:hypothetical protein
VQDLSGRFLRERWSRKNVISTDKSALLWMYRREIARGKVED